MATEIPSQQDIYDLFKNEVQARNSNLTDFEDGSILDSLGGGISVGGQEVLKVLVEKFNKTFFSTAHGPEVTGSTDDLELLATDHFGEGFARPEASPAVGIAVFSRPTADAGNVLIPAGTIVKSEKDANGNEQRFATEADVTMIGLTINASVEAVEAGSDGNVNTGTIIVIESALTDSSIIVTNDDPFSGGEAEATDSEYREFIRNAVEVIRGATKAAIEAAAANVPGVEIATAIEFLQAVIEWDIGGSATVGDFFRIPRVRLYLADANGSANQALIDEVEEAILPVRACGVRIDIIGATPLTLDWDASVVLNPVGPNFAELSQSPQLIVDSMEEYIHELPIGTGFDRGLSKLEIMEIWGPSGTNDLTDFTTNTPQGGVSATENEKLIPGTIAVS